MSATNRHVSVKAKGLLLLLVVVLTTRFGSDIVCIGRCS